MAERRVVEGADMQKAADSRTFVYTGKTKAKGAVYHTISGVANAWKEDSKAKEETLESKRSQVFDLVHRLTGTEDEVEQALIDIYGDEDAGKATWKKMNDEGNVVRFENHTDKVHGPKYQAELEAYATLKKEAKEAEVPALAPSTLVLLSKYRKTAVIKQQAKKKREATSSVSLIERLRTRYQDIVNADDGHVLNVTSIGENGGGALKVVRPKPEGKNKWSDYFPYLITSNLAKYELALGLLFDLSDEKTAAEARAAIDDIAAQLGAKTTGRKSKGTVPLPAGRGRVAVPAPAVARAPLRAPAGAALAKTPQFAGSRTPAFVR